MWWAGNFASLDTARRCSGMLVASKIPSRPAFYALLMRNEDNLNAKTLVEAGLGSEDALDTRTKCALVELVSITFRGL